MNEPERATLIPKSGPESKPVRIDGTEMVVDLNWAKRSCKHCHGTGFLGTRLIDGGKKREKIVCTCVGKEFARRQRVLGGSDGVQR
ncbi:MAG TPA: hypothetical protein VLI71_05790 [Gammaproteobacteria bacterium]|nr:hypothetical protein [Gammaproteobacteria bacterium]